MIQSPHKTICRRGVLALVPLLLTACDSGDSIPSCDYLSGNLLQDNAFTSVHAPRAQRKWHISQHAGDKSFEFEVTDSALSIVKTGTEPWTIITQGFEDRSLAGKTIEFSAELKMDLLPPEPTHGFKHGAGLTLMAKRGNKPIIRSSLDHEPHMGQHDWNTARVVFTMPKKLDYLRVGFLHQASGEIEIRNPSLREVAADCPNTVIAKK